jgi:hypothetical protein
MLAKLVSAFFKRKFFERLKMIQTADVSFIFLCTDIHTFIHNINMHLAERLKVYELQALHLDTI